MYRLNEFPCVRSLNRDQIKYFVVLAMTLNHASLVLLSPEHPLYEPFVDIGYVTAMTMCYFLVEGYYHTRSVRNYALRLFLAAVVSQPIYAYAFGYQQLNMFFTVLAGLAILYVGDHVQPPARMKLLSLSIILATAFCDWPFFFAAGAYFLNKYRGSRKHQACVYAVIGIFFALFNADGYMNQPEMSFLSAVFHSLLSSLGIAAAALLVLVLYNGKTSARFPRFNKWFFYVYYPLHLGVLCLLRAWM